MGIQTKSAHPDNRKRIGVFALNSSETATMPKSVVGRGLDPAGWTPELALREIDTVRELKSP